MTNGTLAAESPGEYRTLQIVSLDIRNSAFGFCAVRANASISSNPSGEEPARHLPHAHELQHLKFENVSTSFVVSGGGGASITKLKKPERKP